MTLTIMYSDRMKSLIESIMKLRVDYDNIEEKVSKVQYFLEMTKHRDYKKESIDTINNIEIKDLNFAYPNASENEKNFLQLTIKRLQKYESK